MKSEPKIESLLQQTITRLLDYCNRNNWSGFDPYDGLNSKIFSAFPFLQNKICRLIFIQAIKRSPINFRHIFLVPKGENPKGLAVFCLALFILSKTQFGKDISVLLLLNRLIELRSPNSPYYCWGYNFDWQARDGFLPQFAPNIICTSFAGNALLDAYDNFSDDKYLNMALSAGDFLINGLNITRMNDELCFSYTQFDWSQVHNANLLGAAFLSRLYSITQNERLLEPASKAVLFSVRRQNENGSWPYGEDKTQRWIDNFHTGYNLIALKKFSEYSKNSDFAENIMRGFQFYKENFFTDDGITKYYHNKTYPIDIHSIAQSIITLVEFKTYDEDNMALAKLIFTKSLKIMKSKNDYFYFQKNRFFKNRIPYMRWSQAWMLLALTTLLQALLPENIVSP